LNNNLVNLILFNEINKDVNDNEYKCGGKLK
jgi:hypothetical protein